MSVINQMLRDLDARGQGDGAARRAALASVGQSVGHRDSPWRSRGFWWLVAAVTVALAMVAVLIVVDRWRTLEGMAMADRDSPATERTPALVDAVALAQDAPSTTLPDTEPAPATEPEATVPSPATVTSRPVAVTPPSETLVPSVASTPSPVPTPPPAEPPAASDPPPRPEPASATAPARATIERVATVADPLDAARTALAEGRADTALAELAVQPNAGPERDALEAAALQQLGRHAEAEQAYRRALQREPDIGAWWAGLGIALDAGGRGEEALAAFREAQRRGPLDPALADYLGERVEALSAGEPSR